MSDSSVLLARIDLRGSALPGPRQLAGDMDAVFAARAALASVLGSVAHRAGPHADHERLPRMSGISAVLFDFAGVLTSSPWGALTAAGGGNLELLIGSYEDRSDPSLYVRLPLLDRKRTLAELLKPTAAKSDGVIRLRPPEERDARRIAQICADPEIARWTNVPSPYTLALIRLKEGPRLTAQVTDTKPGDVKVVGEDWHGRLQLAEAIGRGGRVRACRSAGRGRRAACHTRRGDDAPGRGSGRWAGRGGRGPRGRGRW